MYVKCFLSFLWFTWSLFCCTSNFGTLFLLLSQKHCPNFVVQQIGIQVPIIILFNFRFSLRHFPLWLFAQNTMENANQNQRTLQCYKLSLKNCIFFFSLSAQFGSCSCIWTVSSVLRISIYIWDMGQAMGTMKMLLLQLSLGLHEIHAAADLVSKAIWLTEAFAQFSCFK